MPNEMDRELLKTLHVHSEDLPFIEFLPGYESRILHVRPSDKLVVTQVRAQPGSMSALHRHPSPVYGWTLDGSWGHDHEYKYRPGTYIFETPSVIHRFVNGPSVTEAVFVSTGDLEFIDPETREVINVARPQELLDIYVAASEELGYKPKVLS